MREKINEKTGKGSETRHKTIELKTLAEQLISGSGGTSFFKGYNGSGGEHVEPLDSAGDLDL